MDKEFELDDVDYYDPSYKIPALLGQGVHAELRQSIPEPIRGLEGVRVLSIAPEAEQILVLAVDGTAFSWGRGWSGQLGHGDRETLEYRSGSGG